MFGPMVGARERAGPVFIYTAGGQDPFLKESFENQRFS
jgi:hypothetical protein